jgi:S-adenosylmethionine synthetase
MEATSGKNPVNHVGKIYNLLSNEIAKDVTKNVDGVAQIHLMILSQIGKPIDQPKTASAQIILKEGYSLNSVKSDVEVVVDSWLENTNKIMDLLIHGKLRTF